MQYNFTLTPQSASLFVGPKPYVARNTHPNFNKIVSAIISKQFEKAVKLFDIKLAVKTQSKGKFTITNGVVYYNSTPIHNAVCSKILDFLAQGEDINPWVKFLEKLLDNPSKYIFNNLYSYMEKYKLSIDKDGDIYALKAVKSNLKSKWTDSVQYIVGEAFSEPRVFLRDDSNDGYCGPGLWFGHEQFVFGYGGGNDHVLVVKVNPKDVIAIPSLASFQKMAACSITPILDLGEISTIDGFSFNSNNVHKVKYNGDFVVKSVKQKRDKFGRFARSN